MYVADIWTPWEIDRKYLKSSEMWWWRRMEKISWTDNVKNETITQSQGGKGHPAIKNRRKANWIDHILLKNCLKNALLKESWREG